MSNNRSHASCQPVCTVPNWKYEEMGRKDCFGYEYSQLLSVI